MGDCPGNRKDKHGGERGANGRVDFKTEDGGKQRNQDTGATCTDVAKEYANGKGNEGERDDQLHDCLSIRGN
jgi:hypothetical protein